MSLYRKIFNDYSNNKFIYFPYDGRHRWDFPDFINISYYYFLENDLFNSNPSGVIDFLTHVCESIQYYVDKMNTYNIRTLYDMYNFIDYIYKSDNKVIIKE